MQFRGYSITENDHGTERRAAENGRDSAEKIFATVTTGFLQKGDLFKDIIVFATDDAILEETVRNPSVIDWTRYLCLAINLRQVKIIEGAASEKNVPSNKIAVCHMMILEDVSKLPSVDSSGISLSSLDESHLGLVNQKWKRKAWILTYSTCAMGMLYTLPEHRGKGYAKALISTMAKKLSAKDYPVYCFIEEQNIISYSLFKSLGFTEDPSCRKTWLKFNTG
ncbi:hypothetical protein Q8A73_001524 [Channa argus]|nr:hypothetical protein Q8A73_001524 [Channa argus]